MFTIYVYVLDTLADWELGHVISELNSGRFFQKRRAACIAQNSQLYEGSNPYNGWSYNHA